MQEVNNQPCYTVIQKKGFMCVRCSVVIAMATISQQLRFNSVINHVRYALTHFPDTLMYSLSFNVHSLSLPIIGQ